jgi:hypothetical protein
MSSTNFKDKVSEITQQKAKLQDAEDSLKNSVYIENSSDQLKSVNSESDEVDYDSNSFSKQVSVNQIKESLYKELEESVRQELEQKLKTELEKQITEKISTKLKEDFESSIQKTVNERIVESNQNLINTIFQLSEKIDQINASLKIEVPTPVVYVNMPKVTKRINRDKNGLVESVTEEYEQEPERKD